MKTKLVYVHTPGSKVGFFIDFFLFNKVDKYNLLKH